VHFCEDLVKIQQVHTQLCMKSNKIIIFISIDFVIVQNIDTYTTIIINIKRVCTCCIFAEIDDKYTLVPGLGSGSARQGLSAPGTD